MSNTANERAAALASLLTGQSGGEGASTAPALERTGREVYAGGDEARLLIKRASTLGYVKGGVYVRAEAVPGDVVTLTKSQADRLDQLGVTVDPATDLDQPLGEDLLTDEQIKTGKAEDLIAYVTQHPDERDRVRSIEEGRGNKARATVLDATEPTPVEDEEAATAAAQAAEQGNDGGITSE